MYQSRHEECIFNCNAVRIDMKICVGQLARDDLFPVFPILSPCSSDNYQIFRLAWYGFVWFQRLSATVTGGYLWVQKPKISNQNCAKCWQGPVWLWRAVVGVCKSTNDFFARRSFGGFVCLSFSDFRVFCFLSTCRWQTNVGQSYGYSDKKVDKQTNKHTRNKNKNWYLLGLSHVFLCDATLQSCLAFRFAQRQQYNVHKRCMLDSLGILYRTSLDHSQKPLLCGCSGVGFARHHP